MDISEKDVETKASGNMVDLAPKPTTFKASLISHSYNTAAMLDL